MRTIEIIVTPEGRTTNELIAANGNVAGCASYPDHDTHPGCVDFSKRGLDDIGFHDRLLLY